MNKGLPSTIDQLEEAFVQVHDLWRRTPGAGRWPFAGDGPWHLIQGEAGDYAGAGQDGVADVAAPRTSLDRAEVAQRDRVTGWLTLLEVEPRRVVHAATLALFRGEARVPWREVARGLGWGKTTDALAWTYRKALAQLLCRLHGVPGRHWRALVKGEGLAVVPERAVMVVAALGEGVA